MAVDKYEQSDREQLEAIIDNLTLFDDDLMSRVFDGNIAATELILKIFLEREDIKVISVIGQEEIKNPVVGGRNIKLDILAEDGNGEKFDVEVQRNTEGSHVRRARFHSSILDTKMLKENDKFKSLKESFVIFICEHDKFGKKLPIYHVDRIIRETNERFLDGSNIIYVNGTYKGDDPIGRLMHDFSCKKSEDMYYSELSDGVKHFKETERGRDSMCESVKKYCEEQTEKKMIEAFMKAIDMGISKEDAQKIAGITDEQVEKALCVHK